jgi:hypothetical protein
MRPETRRSPTRSHSSGPEVSSPSRTAVSIAEVVREVESASMVDLGTALDYEPALVVDGFTCPRRLCGGIAYAVDGWKWHCLACGAWGTRYELARRVLERPRALERLLTGARP